MPAGAAVCRGGRALKAQHERNCEATDQPIAALLADLNQRGLLKDTLVVWAGEFGRTPHAQNDDGRDHNNKGYTTWMAGGGVKGGLSYGATDEHGYEAVQDKMHIHDWHATLLHLLGLNHEKLTYRYAGRDFRLTDVHGNVAKAILA
jgi:arylsulfatase A-like enzyme